MNNSLDPFSIPLNLSEIYIRGTHFTQNCQLLHVIAGYIFYESHKIKTEVDSPFQHLFFGACEVNYLAIR